MGASFAITSQVVLLQQRLTQPVQWWTASVLQYLDTVKALQATNKVVYQQATDVAFGFLEALCPAVVFRTDPSLVVSNGLLVSIYTSTL